MFPQWFTLFLGGSFVFMDLRSSNFSLVFPLLGCFGFIYDPQGFIIIGSATTKKWKKFWNVLTAQYQNCKQFRKKLPSYHLLSAPQNFCGNFFRQIGTCLEHAQSVRIYQMEVEMHLGGGGGEGQGGMNRAKYEPSSACIHHHPGGPNRHHPCSHQYDARLPSTKLQNSNVCLDGFQSQFLYFCKVFS